MHRALHISATIRNPSSTSCLTNAADAGIRMRTSLSMKLLEFWLTIPDMFRVWRVLGRFYIDLPITCNTFGNVQFSYLFLLLVMHEFPNFRIIFRKLLLQITRYHLNKFLEYAAVVILKEFE